MKFKEISEKSVAELQKELVTMRAEVLSLRVKNRLAQVKNTHKLREIRKDVARILTALKLKS